MSTILINDLFFIQWKERQHYAMVFEECVWNDFNKWMKAETIKKQGKTNNKKQNKKKVEKD